MGDLSSRCASTGGVPWGSWMILAFGVFFGAACVRGLCGPLMCGFGWCIAAMKWVAASPCARVCVSDRIGAGLLPQP